MLSGDVSGSDTSHESGEDTEDPAHPNSESTSHVQIVDLRVYEMFSIKTL